MTSNGFRRLNELLVLGSIILCGPAVAASSAASGAPRQHSVEIDGRAIEYTSTLTDDGVLVLAGRETIRGRRFRFRVARNGWVRGEVGGEAVTFHVSDAERTRAIRAHREGGSGR